MFCRSVLDALAASAPWGTPMMAEKNTGAGVFAVTVTVLKLVDDVDDEGTDWVPDGVLKLAPPLVSVTIKLFELNA